jgi:hypothetical protein
MSKLMIIKQEQENRLGHGHGNGLDMNTNTGMDMGMAMGMVIRVCLLYLTVPMGSAAAYLSWRSGYHSEL